jgi:hypothetical protein
MPTARIVAQARYPRRHCGADAVRIVATRTWFFCGTAEARLYGRYCPDRDVLAAGRTRREVVWSLTLESAKSR